MKRGNRSEIIVKKTSTDQGERGVRLRNIKTIEQKRILRFQGIENDR